MKMNTFSTLMISGLMLASAVNAIAPLALTAIPTSMLTTYFATKNQNDAARFESVLEGKALAGDVIAERQLKEFKANYQTSGIATYAPTVLSTASVATAFVSALDYSIQIYYNYAAPLKALPGVAVTFAAGSIVATGYDYKKFNDAKQAVNAITAETIKQEAAKAQAAASKLK